MTVSRTTKLGIPGSWLHECTCVCVVCVCVCVRACVCVCVCVCVCARVLIWLHVCTCTLIGLAEVDWHQQFQTCITLNGVSGTAYETYLQKDAHCLTCFSFPSILSNVEYRTASSKLYRNSAGRAAYFCFVTLRKGVVNREGPHHNMEEEKNAQRLISGMQQMQCFSCILL